MGFKLAISEKSNMNKNQWLKDLQRNFGDKDILFAEDIAGLVEGNNQVVKCLKAGLSIPLPTVKVGRYWGIPIADVAEWMSCRSTQLKTQESQNNANRRLQAPARRRPSLGRSLLGLKVQLEELQAQQEFLESVIKEVTILEYIAEQELAEINISRARQRRSASFGKPDH